MKDSWRGHSFVTQAMILAAASLISRFIGFIYILPLTDMIGDDGNGLYARAYYVYNFFLILSSAGMPAAISKLVAERVHLGRREEAHRLFRVALVVAAVFGLICMAAIYFGAGFITEAMNATRSLHALLTLAPTVFIVAIMAIYRGYFQGLGTTIPTSVSQVVEQIFNASFSLILAGAFMGMTRAAADPASFGAAGATAGTGVGAAFGLVTILIFFAMNRRQIAARRSDKDLLPGAPAQKQPSNLRLAWLIIRTTLPIITGMAIMSFTNLIDATMATTRLVAGGFTLAEADILYGQLSGKYAHIINLPIAIATAFSLASIPSITSSKVLKDTQAVESKIKTSLGVTMLICVPSAAGLAVLGTPIIQMLFVNYNEGGLILQVGAVNIIFIALNQILTGPLQATGHLKIPVIAAAAGSICKIIANHFLIPIPAINIKGAVISSSICFIVAASINWFWLKRKTGVRVKFWSLMLKPLLCSVIMALISLGLYNLARLIGLGNTLSTMIAILFGIVSYMIMMILSKGISKKDLLLMPFGKKIVRILERIGMIYTE